MCSGNTLAHIITYFWKLSSERAIIHQWSTNASLFLGVGVITGQAIHSVWKIFNYYSPISPIKGVLFIYGMRLRCLAFSNKQTKELFCRFPRVEHLRTRKNCLSTQRVNRNWLSAPQKKRVILISYFLSLFLSFLFFFHGNTKCWLVRLTVNEYFQIHFLLFVFLLCLQFLIFLKKCAEIKIVISVTSSRLQTINFPLV